MTLILPDEWRLVGIARIEPKGREVIISSLNSLVIAGPGAGKTELLAQRACYLLQTGTCPEPYRILAISFKRDAAKNLRKRVALRCGHKLARRFDSLTLDAFAKGILDRFHLALPPILKFERDYELRFDISDRQSLRTRLVKCSIDAPDIVNEILRSNAEVDFFDKYVIGKDLRRLFDKDVKGSDLLAQVFWRDAMYGGSIPHLNFPMIGRLADLILRTNPMILNALRGTYKYVFLDEFQDTTGVQYELTSTAFKGSNSVLTAVGDPKQRIMVWAGALEGIFSTFIADFRAILVQLVMNYRSAPKLVAIQKHLIKALDPDAPIPEADESKASLDGECIIFKYRTSDQEVKHLVSFVESMITLELIPPDEICILTRNWNDRYTSQLILELSKLGIRARAERYLQDLLAEPIVDALLSMLRLAFCTRHSQSWIHMVELLMDIRIIGDSAKAQLGIEKELAKYCNDLRKNVGEATSAEAVQKTVSSILGFIGLPRLKQGFPQYQKTAYLDDVIKQFTDEFAPRLHNHGNWLNAVDDFCGKDSIPIMTVHKSKGLEYHTVIFVGWD